jgi:uncharacterized protein
VSEICFDTLKPRPYHCAPMSTQARTDAVSPHELARKGGQFTGEIPFVAFPRLASLVVGNVVRVALQFERDDHDRTRVHGRAATTVTMECQRCVEPVERHIVAEIDFRVVGSDDDAREIADEIDAFVWTGDDIGVAELIEDDLILALPNQVCEAYDACPRRPELKYPTDARDEPEPRSNPFAALADWQNRRN